MLIFSENKDYSTLFITVLVSLSLFLGGCASTEVIEGEAEAVEIEVTETDPYEDFNRVMFGFNEGMDDYIAAPISDAYLWVTPQFLQTGVANFFNNLKEINVVLNDVMQGKIAQGAEDTGRFAVNSTIGLLGLFDVATELGLEKHDEDFAQTLAVWGVPQGPYLVLPVLGPSTSRGVPGAVFDTAANPATYVGFPVQLVQMLNSRANAEGALQFIDEAALDPYVFTRESFLQYRKFLITDGESEIADDTLDFEDEFYDEDELIGDLEFSNASELSTDVPPVAKTNVDDQLDNTVSYPQEPNAEIKDVEQVSESFDSTAISVEEAINVDQ
ncbi:MAG: VacJ family lipoprotein [Methylococcaceae bacterium]